MSKDDAPIVATVNFARHSNGKPVTVEAFFVSKLGVNIGKRLYEELVLYVETATQSSPGEPAVVFDDKHGRILSLHISSQ